MRIRDCELHVRISGEGTPLLWTHGLLSGSAPDDAFGTLWEPLPPGLQLVRYDARGHGRSAASSAAADYTWSNLGRDMLALADALGAERLIAGGWSLGCVSAIHAALLAPQRFKGLILMLPPAVWEARTAQRRLYRLAARLAQAPAGPVLPDWLAAAEPEHALRAAERARAMPAATVTQLFEAAALSDLPPRAELARLAEVPVLLVACGGDPTHPLTAAQALHQLLPRSTLCVAHDYQQWLELRARMHAFALACR